jgi:hypothetical protein
MDDIHVRLLKLPSTVYGVTVRDENGDFNVYINSNLSAPARDRALKHEMKHIKRGDFYSDDCIETLEENMP